MLRVLIYLLKGIRFNKSLNKRDPTRKMPLPLLMALAAEEHLAGQSRRLTEASNKLKSLMKMMMILTIIIIIIIIGHPTHASYFSYLSQSQLTFYRRKSPVMERFPNLGNCIISYKEMLRSVLKDVTH
jgi:hypothetical protein